MLNFTSIKEAATRPDFYKLLDVGNKLKMFDVYNKVDSEYEQYVSFETSTKAKETYPSLSDIGDPELVLEGDPFKEAGIGAMQDVEITNYKYGRILAITREMVDFDQTKKIKDQPGKLGKAHKNFENKIVFSAIVNGATAGTCYDGLAIYTTNHLNRAGGAAQANNDNIYTAVTLSAGSIIVAMDMINLWKGLDDDDITVNPIAIAVTPRLSYTARWLMQGTGLPAYAANVLGAASAYASTVGNNPLPMLKVWTSKWLGKMTSNPLDWYIWTDVPGWVWQWFQKLELYKEGNLASSWFERDVMRWKSRTLFGFKNIDWRASMLIS